MTGSLAAGSVVRDRYRLMERIGVGGTGEIWRAFDLLLDVPVALQRASLTGVHYRAECDRERALLQARIAARLRHHRHVVTNYDVCIDDHGVWLVQEYLRSRSLAQVLRERGPLSPGRASRIGAQVADALAAAHELGIEHHNVTPDTVLITDDGAAKLTGFGSCPVTGDPRIAQPEMSSGTVARPSDVFALGCTLYAAIEGRSPWHIAASSLEQRTIIGAGVIRPPTAARSLTPVLLRLLEADPAVRPDAATTRDLLDQFCWGDQCAHAGTACGHV